MKILETAMQEAKEAKERNGYIGQIAIRQYELHPRKLTKHFTKDVHVGDRGGYQTGNPYVVVAVI